MRIGIVNDLSLAREVLRRLVLSMPGDSVAWVAQDGDEAVTRAAADRPDLILMDLVMPRLNGVEAVRRIMKASPCPILVVTSTVSGNYDLVIQAMGAGALDAVETPTLGSGGVVANGEKLVARIAKLRAALSEVSRSSLAVPGDIPEPTPNLPPLVVVGASTGGPDALAVVFGAFKADFPGAVLVAQHIGAEFASGLAQQLSYKCPLPVRIAQEGERPTPGTVLIAASNDHLTLTANRSLRYTSEPKQYPYRPSVDVLFASAGAYWTRPGVAALLTGMGTDGAEGLSFLRTLGWHTIAQDEPSCVVYGMPRAAAEKRAAVEVLPLSQIGPTIVAKVLMSQRR